MATKVYYSVTRFFSDTTYVGYYSTLFQAKVACLADSGLDGVDKSFYGEVDVVPGQKVYTLVGPVDSSSTGGFENTNFLSLMELRNVFRSRLKDCEADISCWKEYWDDLKRDGATYVPEADVDFMLLTHTYASATSFDSISEDEVPDLIDECYVEFAQAMEDNLKLFRNMDMVSSIISGLMNDDTFDTLMDNHEVVERIASENENAKLCDLAAMMRYFCEHDIPSMLHFTKRAVDLGMDLHTTFFWNCIVTNPNVLCAREIVDYIEIHGDPGLGISGSEIRSVSEQSLMDVVNSEDAVLSRSDADAALYEYISKGFPFSQDGAAVDLETMVASLVANGVPQEKVKKAPFGNIYSLDIDGMPLLLKNSDGAGAILECRCHCLGIIGSDYDPMLLADYLIHFPDTFRYAEEHCSRYMTEKSIIENVIDLDYLRFRYSMEEKNGASGDDFLRTAVPSLVGRLGLRELDPDNLEREIVRLVKTEEGALSPTLRIS